MERAGKVWEKWRRGVWSGVVEAGEEGKRGVVEHSPFVVGLEIAGGAGFEVVRQFGGGFKLGHGVEFFEGGGKRIGEAPERTRLKIWILRRKIQIVDAAGEMFGTSSSPSTKAW